MGDACCITPLSRALCLSPGHGRSPKFLIVFKNLFHFFRISLLLTPFCQQCGGFFFFQRSEVTDIRLSIIHLQTNHAEEVKADTQVRRPTHNRQD